MRKSEPINRTNVNRAMMQAIHYWLNYTCKVSRVDLLAESSIRFPLMEYIERYLEAETCYLERKYEDFLSEDIFNAHKYIDVMWEKGNTEYLIELKYISKHTKQDKEKQRFFNDLVRLSLALKLSKDGKQRKCYFLVCGDAQCFGEQMCGIIQYDTINNVGNSITKQKNETIETEFAKWLALEEDEQMDDTNVYKSIKYNDTDSRFVNFCKDYFENSSKDKKKKKDKKDNRKYLGSFKTRKIWLNAKNDEKMTGLWEILLEESYL